jgi:hypothetical protein
MSQILAATRKGLFTLERAARGQWRVRNASFVGDRVSMTLVDPRDGTWYAALDHGHFGGKMQRSEDRGATWTEGVSAQARGLRGHDGRWQGDPVERAAHMVPGPRRRGRAGRAVVRHDSRRAVSVHGSRQLVAARR